MSSFEKFILVATWVGIMLALCFAAGFFGILGDKPLVENTNAEIIFKNYDGHTQEVNYTPNIQVMCQQGVYDASRGMCVYQIPTVSYHLDDPTGQLTNQTQFNGTIDEFQVWNKTLREDEIKSLYVQGFMYDAKNDDKWHQITLVIANDTLVRYVDGVRTDAEEIQQANKGNFTVSAWIRH